MQGAMQESGKKESVGYALYRDTGEMERVLLFCTRPLKTFDDAFQAAVAHDLALLRWFKREPGIFDSGPGKNGSKRGLCFNFAYTGRMQLWVRPGLLWAHPKQTEEAAAEPTKGLGERLLNLADLMNCLECQFQVDFRGRTKPVCRVGPFARLLATVVARAAQGPDKRTHLWQRPDGGFDFIFVLGALNDKCKTDFAVKVCCHLGIVCYSCGQDPVRREQCTRTCASLCCHGCPKRLCAGM